MSPKKNKRAPAMLADDQARLSLVGQLGAFRRRYLEEFEDDDGDDLTLISFTIAALADLRYQEQQLARAAHIPVAEARAKLWGDE